MGALASTRLASLGRPALADAALALVLAAAGLIQMAVTDSPAPVWVLVLAVLATTLPLAWRETAPLFVVMVAAVGVLLASFLADANDLPLLLWLAAGAGLYSLGEHGSNAQLLIGGALTTVIYASIGVIEDDPGGAALGGYWAKRYVEPGEPAGLGLASGPSALRDEAVR